MKSTSIDCFGRSHQIDQLAVIQAVEIANQESAKAVGFRMFVDLADDPACYFVGFFPAAGAEEHRLFFTKPADSITSSIRCQ